FEDRSYLKSGENRIILQVDELGAGMDAEGIKANFGAFGLSNSEAPTDCEEKDGLFQCYWDIDEDLSEGVITLGLSRFQDNVGNEGEAPEVQFFVDNTGPKIHEMELYGVSEAGDKNHFQSNDVMKIVLKISEMSGLRIFVNEQDLVLDAESDYPANEFIDEDGWQVFTQEDCEKEGGYWQCELQTKSIKSGPDSDVGVDIKVQDTAGNDALQWPEDDKVPKNVNDFTVEDELASFSIEILGLSTEENPDYWEVRKVTPLGGADPFIDLDTTPLTYTRLPFKISLESSIDDVQALNIELINCLSESEVDAAAATVEQAQSTADVQAAAPASGTSPIISRALLYGGITPTGAYAPTPNVIIEFEPFDGRSLFKIGQQNEESFTKHYEDYVCNLRIYSQVGKNSLKAAEIQQVTVSVPFGFSALGAQDENLEQTIQDARDDVEGAWKVIGVLAEIMKWIDYLLQVYQLIVKIIDVIAAGIEGLEPTYVTPARAGGVAACFGMNSASYTAGKIPEIIDQIVQVLSCNPSAKDNLGWYGNYQRALLSLYNVEILKAPGEVIGANEINPSRSIRDNLFLSFAGLCIPGIIKNLDEFRQIKCRKIACLENEVRAGTATVNMCNQLESLLICKYVTGELWYLIPFSQFFDKAINALRAALADPFAIAHTASILVCGIECVADPGLVSGCEYVYYIWDIFGTLEQIAGFVTTIIAEVKNGGLQYCDAVL
ncbi:MAG: hypothetical protein AABX05_02565, partial [Nanoarchaeota archaeon]